MKKNKIAFTLIELIVVSLIMVLLTTSSVFYFFDFTDNRELIIRADILEDSVSDLSKQVKGFEISDYSLYFAAGANYYTGSINNLGTQNRMVLSIGLDGRGDFLIVGGDESLVWNYVVHEDDKEVVRKITPANQSQEYQFDTSKNYEIRGHVTNNTTNEIFSTNTLIVKSLSSIDSGVELISPDLAVFSNKNNLTTPVDLELSKGSAIYILELK